MVNGLDSIVQGTLIRERTMKENPVSPSPETEKPYASEPADYSSRIEDMNERDSYSSCWDSND